MQDAGVGGTHVARVGCAGGGACIGLRPAQRRAAPAGRDARQGWLVYRGAAPHVRAPRARGEAGGEGLLMAARWQFGQSRGRGGASREVWLRYACSGAGGVWRRPAQEHVVAEAAQGALALRARLALDDSEALALLGGHLQESGPESRAGR